MPPTEQATNGFDPFGQWQAMRDRGMETWSKMMQEFVQSDEYASASAQWLDTYLTLSKSFQRVMDQAMTQTMSQYKVPSTEDIGRLAERLWNVELKLDDLDARMDDLIRLTKELSARSATTAEPAPPAAIVPEAAPPAAVPPQPEAIASPVVEAKAEAVEAPIETPPVVGVTVQAAAPSNPPVKRPTAPPRKTSPPRAPAGKK